MPASDTRLQGYLVAWHESEGRPIGLNTVAGHPRLRMPVLHDKYRLASIDRRYASRTPAQGASPEAIKRTIDQRMSTFQGAFQQVWVRHDVFEIASLQ